MRIAGAWLLLLARVAAAINVNESSTQIVISNERLTVSLTKARGNIQGLVLDGQDLLGPVSGNIGSGPYLDCYCTPDGFYTPGRVAPEYTIFQGDDYAGVVMGETHAVTGQRLEFYYFLRDGETGLHNFARLAYFNETTPSLRNLQEFRTMFRPNSPIWTHLSTNARTFAPLPSKEAFANQVVVQDATWYLGNAPNDPYVQQMSDYFTKYTFQDLWRDHKVHGMFADGTQTNGNFTFGSWLVMNTRDTYFNGPQNSDLVVDGIVYNYIASNHHGNGTPNITTGFDRTFGPFYYHFNRGEPGAALEDLRKDAEKYADSEWNADLYDEIAEHVPGYVPTSGRGKFRAVVTLPLQLLKKKWSRPVVVLTVPGVDFQDNAVDSTAYQYWADIKTIGSIGVVEIPRVKAGTYRLTIYADGLFGQYEKDGVVVKAGKTTNTIAVVAEPNFGRELWRIGTPDKSSGEFRHGYAPDKTKPLQPEEYRIYWARWDFIDDFPDGVTFRVGESKEATDFNYVHWSLFGGKDNYLRNVTVYSPKISNWTVLFNTSSVDLRGSKQATLSVQLAGAKTTAGNLDVYDPSSPLSNLPFVVTINGNELEPWIIPAHHSSSCVARSAVSCYGISHDFTFAASLLKTGENSLVFRLPADEAKKSAQVYVQYDALRLSVS